MSIQQSQVKDCKQCIQRLNENDKSMTKKEIDRAKAALDLQEYLGWASTQELYIINGNNIRNININVNDIKKGIHLYGMPTPCLKGKMKRRRPLSHDTWYIGFPTTAFTLITNLIMMNL